MEIAPKDTTYIVAGYRLSDIASIDVSKKEFDGIEEITGKPKKYTAEVHSLLIFGKLTSLPLGGEDPSDPMFWTKKLFGLNAFFTERKEKEAKGLLRFNLRTIVIGSLIASNCFNGHSICNSKNGSVIYRGTEKICKLPDNMKPHLDSVKATLLSYCGKFPEGFPEPCIFLI